jgi:hypothetical protein
MDDALPIFSQFGQPLFLKVCDVSRYRHEMRDKSLVLALTMRCMNGLNEVGRHVSILGTLQVTGCGDVL